MRISVALAGAICALTLTAFATPSSAATFVPNLSTGAQSQVEQVHWTGYWHRHRWGGGWGYCRRWRHECADRWGWGTWQFRRCLRRHGC